MKICPICHGKYETHEKCPKCNVALLDLDNLKQDDKTEKSYTVDKKNEMYQAFNKKMNDLKENGFGGQKLFSGENTNRKAETDDTYMSNSQPGKDDTYASISRPGKDDTWASINQPEKKDAGASTGQSAMDAAYASISRPETESTDKNRRHTTSNNVNSVSIPVPALIGGGIVFMLIILGLFVSMSKKDDTAGTGSQSVIEAGNEMNEDDGDSMQPVSEDTTEEDEYEEEEQEYISEESDTEYVEEEQGMTLPYTDNSYPDISSCLSEADFASVYSEDNSFHFCYPKYLFNSFSYNEEKQEYYFSYEENGNEICSLRVYKLYNPNSNVIDAAKNLRYQFQNYYYKANYYWPAEDLSKLTTDQNSAYKEPRGDGMSRYIMSGWTTYDQSRLLYSLGANDGTYDYILEFSYPEYNTNDDMEDWDYVTECIYRSCSFSGTNYAVRSYDTFIKEGYGEGHH